MTVTYVDLDSIHRASNGAKPPHGWGDQVNDNFKAIHDCPWQASGYRSSVQSIPNSAPTRVSFDAELYDDNANFNVATGQYTVPTSGLYIVDATIAMSTSGSGITYCAVFNGASEVKRGNQYSLNVPTPSPTVAGQLKCTAGDVLSVIVFQNSGGALNTFSGAPFVFFDVAFLR